MDGANLRALLESKQFTAAEALAIVLHLFTDGTGTAKATHLLPGVFVAYALSVLTAAMGALQLQEALKAGKKQA